MEDVEDVEDEAKVTIHLPEPGPIGRPIVQVSETTVCARGQAVRDDFFSDSRVCHLLPIACTRPMSCFFVGLPPLCGRCVELPTLVGVSLFVPLSKYLT